MTAHRSAISLQRSLCTALLMVAASPLISTQGPTPTPESKLSTQPSPTPGSNRVSAPAHAQTTPQATDKMWQGGKSVAPVINELGNRPPGDGGIEILSETEGVDFRPYMKDLKASVQKHWEPLVPESALPPVMKSGRVIIKFSILKDGSVRGMTLVQSSGDAELDRAAWGALTSSSPFQGLPAAYSKDFLVLRCNFFYNPGKDDKTKTPPPHQPDVKK